MPPNRPNSPTSRAKHSDPIHKTYPIVGIGFSAGGLEAFQDFVQGIDPDTRTSYIVVQHLATDYRSHLLEIIESSTPLTVRHPEAGQLIEPASIYVLKEDAEIRLESGHFALSPLPQKTGPRSSIDSFFDSLAEEKAEYAVGVVLSGSASDGTVGLQKIKARGGMCLAQTPGEAGFSSMPKSAIENGCVDYVGAAAELARKADAYFKHRETARSDADKVDSDKEKHLLRILDLVRKRSGNDFSDYRRTSILRRVERRMSLSNVSGLAEYFEVLNRHESEVKALSENILISVTCFFREPEIWQTLAKQGVSKLLENKKDGDAIRVWVPGCATGEEVYTLAILFNEAITESNKDLNLKIYGTDIDNHARKIAHAGVYPAGIAGDVGEHYLKKYFEPVANDRYVITAALREKVTFARQNILSDPPFSRMDLVSCRNLLIYLETSMQKRVIRLLHFALREGGIALLGASETIGEAKHYFETIHREHRIYQRTEAQNLIAKDGTIPFPLGRAASKSDPIISRPSDSRTMEEISRALTMEHFAALSAIVDRYMSVHYLEGNTERYLHQPEGVPTLDLRSMVNPSVALKLRQFGKRTLENKTTHSFETSLETSEGDRIRITLKPIRLKPLEDGLFILFESVDATPGTTVVTASNSAADQQEHYLLTGLDRDLKEARDELTMTVAELETSNEELRTSNEEVMSMNEELQASNQELETSKEELDSLNEVINTINKQLSSKVNELERSHNDVRNLLTSTNIATIFIDENLRIQRFTPATSRLLNLIQSDIGRPISDLVGNLSSGNLIATCRSVLDDLKSREDKVEGLEQTYFLRRVLPYRTKNNRIEGIVITFDDITSQVAHEMELERAKEGAEAANRAKSRFLSSMSHDIRTPLTAIMGLSEVLGESLDKDLREMGGEIQNACNHLLQTIDSVLNLAHLQSGQLQLPSKPIHLEEILEEIRAVFEPGPTCATDRKRIRTDLEDASLRVQAEKGALLRVLSNLVGNALKFCPDEVIEIRVVRDAEHARIEVSDKGPGISADFQKELFKPFTQERHKQKSSLSGSGLGLSITHELVGLILSTGNCESSPSPPIANPDNKKIFSKKALMIIWESLSKKRICWRNFYHRADK